MAAASSHTSTESEESESEEEEEESAEQLVSSPASVPKYDEVRYQAPLPTKSANGKPHPRKLQVPHPL